MDAYDVADRLEELFPEIEGIVARSATTIFLGDAAEGGTINGVPACNYNSFEEDPNEHTWIMGVHVELDGVLHEFGWFAECADPGTYFAYRG